MFARTLAQQTKEMDRLAERYAMPLGRFWLYFRVGDLRINVETDEATYRNAHRAEWPDFDDPMLTPPIEVSWWHTKQIRPFYWERGGWVDPPDTYPQEPSARRQGDAT